MVEPYPITGALKMLEVDAEKFGAGLAQVMREALAPLKKQIEELQQRVKELENLTEGLK